jgi:hypothetical protein
MVKTKKNTNQSKYYSKKRNLAGGSYVGQVSTMGNVSQKADLMTGSLKSQHKFMSANKSSKNIIMYLESESHGAKQGAASYKKAVRKLKTFRQANIGGMQQIITTLSSSDDSIKAKGLDQLRKLELTCSGERMNQIRTERTSTIEQIKATPVHEDKSKSQAENELNNTVQETRGVVLDNLATLVYDENLKLETALTAIISDPKTKNFKNAGMI